MGTRAGHDSSQNGDTTRTGAVLPDHQPDVRPDTIGRLWPQVFHPARTNDNRAKSHGGEIMLVQISEIKINAGRREADQESVQELADSISKVGFKRSSENKTPPAGVKHPPQKSLKKLKKFVSCA